MDFEEDPFKSYFKMLFTISAEVVHITTSVMWLCEFILLKIPYFIEVIKYELVEFNSMII